jgi:hypothetical protein
MLSDSTVRVVMHVSLCSTCVQCDVHHRVLIWFLHLAVRQPATQHVAMLVRIVFCIWHFLSYLLLSCFDSWSCPLSQSFLTSWQCSALPSFRRRYDLQRLHNEELHTHTHTHTHTHECVSKSFRTESITKYTLTTINTRWEATERVMATKLTRLTYKITIPLHSVAESCTICSSRSGRPVRKLLNTPSYY